MRNEQQTRRLAILSSATAQRVGLKQTYATMRKSALIATCLTHSAMVPDVNAGEAAVRQVAHYTLVGVLINGYAVESRPGDGLTF